MKIPAREIVGFLAAIVFMWLLLLSTSCYIHQKINTMDQIARPGTSIAEVQNIFGSGYKYDQVKQDNRWLVPPDAATTYEYSFFGGSYCYIYVSKDGYIIKTYWYKT